MVEVVDVSFSSNYIGIMDKKETKRYLYFFFKRAFDIVVSLVGLIVLLPIFLLISILIKKEDKGPVIIVQKRIGKNNREFNFYKFRSMIINADEELERILKKDKKLREEYKINKKLNNDPRITKIGKYIRKFSIDELPQLINVLKGDMSIVGNRPYLPRERKDMGYYLSEVIKTKPGLTGYWQISGRSNNTFQKRLNLETFYSNNYSLLFDLKIFFKTFKVVLFGSDAK